MAKKVNSLLGSLRVGAKTGPESGVWLSLTERQAKYLERKTLEYDITKAEVLRRILDHYIDREEKENG